MFFSGLQEPFEGESWHLVYILREWAPLWTTEMKIIARNDEVEVWCLRSLGSGAALPAQERVTEMWLYCV